MNKHQILYLCILSTLAINVSCTPQSLTSPPALQPTFSTDFVSSMPLSEATETFTPEPTATEVIPVTGGHFMKPADVAPVPGKLIYDVESSGAAAPYGDLYKINRFERPFQGDMTYVSDIDIVTFNLSEDSDWYYISIELSGNDPNNPTGINYGVEIDLDFDGYGDFIIWAHPPYMTTWETNTVQVFKDSDHDSGGVSSLQSDTVSDGNGYDTLVFDGGASQTEDPDLAWVRANEDPRAVVQFAFKKSLIGSFFMLGVISDAGPKDISKFDYNDHVKEADSGSPVKDNQYYPLGSLYAVDNTCWEAYGVLPTGYEPKLCQPILQPTSIPEPSVDETLACIPAYPPESCGLDPNGNPYYDPASCECT
jgi:hypothetical protein